MNSKDSLIIFIVFALFLFVPPPHPSSPAPVSHVDHTYATRAATHPISPGKISPLQASHESSARILKFVRFSDPYSHITDAYLALIKTDLGYNLTLYTVYSGTPYVESVKVTYPEYYGDQMGVIISRYLTIYSPKDYYLAIGNLIYKATGELLYTLPSGSYILLPEHNRVAHGYVAYYCFHNSTTTLVYILSLKTGTPVNSTQVSEEPRVVYRRADTYVLMNRYEVIYGYKDENGARRLEKIFGNRTYIGSGAIHPIDSGYNYAYYVAFYDYSARKTLTIVLQAKYSRGPYYPSVYERKIPYDYSFLTVSGTYSGSSHVYYLFKAGALLYLYDPIKDARESTPITLPNKDFIVAKSVMVSIGLTYYYYVALIFDGEQLEVDMYKSKVISHTYYSLSGFLYYNGTYNTLVFSNGVAKITSKGLKVILTSTTGIILGYDGVFIREGERLFKYVSYDDREERIIDLSLEAAAIGRTGISRIIGGKIIPTSPTSYFKAILLVMNGTRSLVVIKEGGDVYYITKCDAIAISIYNAYYPYHEYYLTRDGRFVHEDFENQKPYVVVSPISANISQGEIEIEIHEDIKISRVYANVSRPYELTPGGLDDKGRLVYYLRFNVSYVYARAGDYTLYVSVYDTRDEVGEAYIPVTLYDDVPPNVDLSARLDTNFTPGIIVDFSATGTGSPVNVTMYVYYNGSVVLTDSYYGYSYVYVPGRFVDLVGVGNYTIVIVAADAYNNTRVVSTAVFVRDDHAPEVEVPENSSIVIGYNASVYTFSYSVSDDVGLRTLYVYLGTEYYYFHGVNNVTGTIAFYPDGEIRLGSIALCRSSPQIVLYVYAEDYAGRVVTAKTVFTIAHINVYPEESVELTINVGEDATLTFYYAYIAHEYVDITYVGDGISLYKSYSTIKLNASGYEYNATEVTIRILGVAPGNASIIVNLHGFYNASFTLAYVRVVDTIKPQIYLDVIHPGQPAFILVNVTDNYIISYVRISISDLINFSCKPNASYYSKTLAFSIPAGEHRIFVKAVDALNNTNEKNVTVNIVDETDPEIYINAPDVREAGYYNVTVNAYDLSEIGTLTVSLDGKALTPIEINESRNRINATFLIRFTYGRHVLTITAMDAYGHRSSVVKTFDVSDTVPPSVSLDVPIEVHKGDNVSVTVRVFDYSPVNVTVYYSYDGSNRVRLGTLSGNGTLGFVADKYMGKIYVKAIAEDSAGNASESQATISITLSRTMKTLIGISIATIVALIALIAFSLKSR